MNRGAQSGELVDQLGDVAVCRGCGLMSHVGTHDGICSECWNRRERRAGGGPIRYVTSADTYHETAACPGVRASSQWWMIRDEEIMYANMAGEVDKCKRCHSVHIWGLDHYRGEDTAVIGHA